MGEKRRKEIRGNSNDNIDDYEEQKRKNDCEMKL